jgi:hypothetical protein
MGVGGDRRQNPARESTEKFGIRARLSRYDTDVLRCCRRKTMPRKRSMTMLRDNDDGEGCIEYSWVPTGQRRSLFLLIGQQQDGRVEELKEASKVQVYVLTQGQESLADWVFPAAGQKEIVSATIAVREAANVVDAIVFYEDGSHESFSRDLENVPRKCPEVVKTQRS